VLFPKNLCIDCDFSLKSTAETPQSEKVAAVSKTPTPKFVLSKVLSGQGQSRITDLFKRIEDPDNNSDQTSDDVNEVSLG
jgi:hypothetical protein